MMCAHDICHTTNGCKHSDSNISLEEQLRISGSQFDQLERENARVVLQLKEVIKMNNHWQRYDAQREEHVLKLTKTNQQLQDQVRDLQRHVEELSATGVSTRRVNSDYMIRAADTTEELSSEQSPSSTNKDEIAAVKEYISELEEKIKTLENSKVARKTGEDDELTMLREQINVCVEDFRHERQDRERIHSENQKLRERLGQSQQIIRRHENQLVKYQETIKKLQEKCQLRTATQYSAGPFNDHDEPWCFPEERPRLQEKNQHKIRTIFRHPIYSGVDLTDLPSDVEIDGVPDEPEDIPDGHLPAGAEALVPDEVKEAEDQKSDEEPLQCPRCLASFPINKHNELLAHINVCMD